MDITIREGSRAPLDFWLQLDRDRDEKPDAALVLTGFQSLEMRVRNKSDGSNARGFLTTDATPQLTVVNAAGTVTAPNGVFASHVQFIPAVGDFLFSVGTYELYFNLIPQSGIQESIPEKGFIQLFVSEKF